ncbi:malonyl-CoA O-methyltransferase [Formivibrio citricus]|uniref:Malonyl-[acyl-carrier protein] O-methyltransferase n=1 Tax=Formivibrio citricus TaxID=83765 RepID=A0A1I4ZSJ0_9NEIS|nr:malonyl-ACP O-methyltransferase BioC [Formivibrio citricus]SFN53202.1 malonyl-CoA O-methyltransferase [Formivibrio citricus]
MSDKSLVRSAFDQAADTYDASAALQREVVERMAEKLEIVKLEPLRMLDVGCGTGYAGPFLEKRFPKAELVELDLAPGMLRATRARQPGGWKRWLAELQGKRFPVQVCGDVEALPLASESVDLVWSSLALQWCDTLDQAFSECLRVLKPGGLFLFSTLGPDTLKELRQAFAGIDGHAHVNRFTDMHDVGDTLARVGFSSPVMEMEMLTMTYETVRDVLRDLKGIGAHSLRDGRRSGLMGKAAWRAMEASYERFRTDGFLPSSYEVLYGHAWKPHGEPAATDKAQVIDFHPRTPK